MAQRFRHVIKVKMQTAVTCTDFAVRFAEIQHRKIIQALEGLLSNV